MSAGVFSLSIFTLLVTLTLCVACQPVSGAIELSTPSPEQQLMDEYRKTLTSLEIQAGFHCMGPIGKDVYDLFEEVVRKQHALDAYTALNGPPDARDREYLENGNYEDATWFSEDLLNALAFDTTNILPRLSAVGEGGKHRITLAFRTDREVFGNSLGDPYINYNSRKTAWGTVDHKTCEPTLLSIMD